MIRTFRVVLNDKEYRAEIEETTPTAAVKAAASMPAPKKTYASAPAAIPSPPANPVSTPVKETIPMTSAISSEDSEVIAPLPSTILRICVKEGETVKNGQLIAVLEAMKMENEVFAPKSGVVKNIAVKEGASVNTGDLLMTIG